MSVRPRVSHNKGGDKVIGWIADVRVDGRRHQRLFKTKEAAERFHGVSRARKSEVLNIALDWFTLPPSFRTKKRLLDMLSGASL